MIKTHQPCDSCGSSDALTDYGESTHCFSCNNHVRKYSHASEEDARSSKRTHKDLTQFEVKNTFKFGDQNTDNTVSVVQLPAPAGSQGNEVSALRVAANNLLPVDSSRFRAITERGISEKAAAFYSIQTKDNGEHVYPYFDLSGKRHIANQFRTAGQKGFLVQGEYNKTALFGQQLFPPGSAKQITLVEGALDAPSAYQMFDYKWPVVAVKSVSSARKEVADNFEYLNSFDKIVICFDKDAEHKSPDGTVSFPGQDAAQKVAAMFPLGKVRVLTLQDAKDPNEYLQKGWASKFQKEWWNAPTWSPVGLKIAKDMWDVVRIEPKYDTVEYPWKGLNDLTYGIRLSELVCITANPKIGKTSVVKEIVHNILQKILEKKDDNRGIGLMMLEEPNRDTLIGLMSLTANKPLHLPDVRSQVSEEELKSYFDATYPDEKIVLWDHFGSNDIDKVLSFVHYMYNLGCKYVVIDHLSIIVSDQSGDERKQLDEITTKLKTLCMELNIAVIVIIHQNRKGEIRGTMGVEQLANIVIKLTRDKKALDEETRNTTTVTVEDNRFCGRTGPACLLYYDGETGRLTELPQESLEQMINEQKEISNEW